MRRQKIRVRKYRDNARPHLKFVVNFRESGKRKRAFFETKQEADTFAENRNIELKNSGREGAEFPTSLRIMAQECAERLRSYGRTIKDATDFFVRHLAASERSITAAKLVEQVLTAKKADGMSNRYVQDLRSRLPRFAKDFDGKMVAEITAKEIDDWLRALEVGPTTRNNFRRTLVMMFSYAAKHGYTTSNPAAETQKAKEIDAPPGILTVQETARLLEAASPELLPYVAIGAFAGLRRAELERLDWSDVHFDDNLIEVTAQKSKTARRRFVKIQPNLREWLLPLRKHKGSVTPDNFPKRLDAARETAGIDDWPDNALRHSFASYHLAHFKDAAALALEMGHTDSGLIFNHYRQLVRPKEAERYWNIMPAPVSKVVPMQGKSNAEIKEFLRTAEVVSSEPLSSYLARQKKKA
jgi:integrase